METACGCLVSLVFNVSLCACSLISRGNWSSRRRSTSGSRRLMWCAISTRQRNLVPPTSCPNSTEVMTHELCRCLLTSDLWPPSVFASSVTDFPLYVNTHVKLTYLKLALLFKLLLLRNTLHISPQQVLISTRQHSLTFSNSNIW